ncbi:hypothetical protein MRB53_022433 [Persea americana]|uniref:Uncharacterized protein n=1 Tax=Persea americana TaxID=3435 RepID=A0ACC2L6Y2_PERAE|nr:hypothetical protein MRB53_022433 [Persea americana]
MGNWAIVQEKISAKGNHNGTNCVNLLPPPHTIDIARSSDEDGIGHNFSDEPGLRGNLDPPLDKEEDDYVDPSPVPDTRGGGQPAPIPH